MNPVSKVTGLVGRRHWHAAAASRGPKGPALHEGPRGRVWSFATDGGRRGRGNLLSRCADGLPTGNRGAVGRKETQPRTPVCSAWLARRDVPGSAMSKSPPRQACEAFHTGILKGLAFGNARGNVGRRRPQTNMVCCPRSRTKTPPLLCIRGWRWAPPRAGHVAADLRDGAATIAAAATKHGALHNFANRCAAHSPGLWFDRLFEGRPDVSQGGLPHLPGCNRGSIVRNSGRPNLYGRHQKRGSPDAPRRQGRSFCCLPGRTLEQFVRCRKRSRRAPTPLGRVVAAGGSQKGRRRSGRC